MDSQKQKEEIRLDGRKTRPQRTVKSAPRRIGWNAGLAHNEIGLRGSTLLAWLIAEANSQGLQLNELAQRLEVSYSYIHQLRTGIKPIPGISEHVVDACAAFLDVPRLAVLVAADIVRMEDIYAAADFVPRALRPALQFIQRDPAWGPFLHPVTFEADQRVQHLLVLLYQEATGRNLMPGRLNAERLMDAMSAKDLEPMKDSSLDLDLEGSPRH